MKKLAILLFVWALIFYVRAQEKPVAKRQVTTPESTATTHQAVLTWTNPTTCTDGSPCTPVNINIYKLVGTCGAATTQFTLLSTQSGTTRTYTDTGLAAATTYCYYVTALLAQPPAWSSTVTYTGGQMVTYNNAVYMALNNANPNLNQPPSTATSFWQTSSVESAPSNTAAAATGTTGPPNSPTNLLVTAQ